MKKTLLILVVLGLTFASCKKDRVCSCKTVISYTGTWTGDPKDKPADVVIDQDHTIVKAGWVTARRACVHRKESGPYSSLLGGGLTQSVDENCALK